MCLAHWSQYSRIAARSIGHDKKLTRTEWKVDTTGTTIPFLWSLKCQIPPLHSAPARKLHERIAFPLSFKPESIAGYLWPVIDHSNREYVQLNARSRCYDKLHMIDKLWSIRVMLDRRKTFSVSFFLFCVTVK